MDNLFVAAFNKGFPPLTLSIMTSVTQKPDIWTDTKIESVHRVNLESEILRIY